MFQLTYEGVRVAHLGKLDTDRFRLSVTHRNPFGRGGQVFEIEVKPLRNEFNGEYTWIPGGVWINPPLGTGTTMMGPPVTMCQPIHWRLRVLFDQATTPFMPSSRWVTIPWNGWNETDMRTSFECNYLPLELKQ